MSAYQKLGTKNKLWARPMASELQEFTAQEGSQGSEPTTTATGASVEDTAVGWQMAPRDSHSTISGSCESYLLWQKKKMLTYTSQT